MQAIILAAGMGKRLKELTQNNTKCMVRVNGVTLIERMLHQLDKRSLSRIVIVIGYEGDKLVDYIRALGTRTPIVYVENPVYDKTNNIYSLSLAKEYLMREDTLLFESDIIFEDAVLDVLIDDPRPTLALVDKYEPWMDGTCVRLDEKDRIVDFISGKKFDYRNTAGCYKTVNIYKFGRHFSETHYVPFLDAYLKALGRNEYYEQVLRVITMLDDAEIRGKRLDGQKWYEIDDVQDLDIASTLFCPDQRTKVLKLEGRFGGYWRFPELMDFCYLVNPYYPPAKMMDEIKASFNTLLTQYPSGMEINSLLAARNFGVRQENILVGNGAAELIKALMNQLTGRIGMIRPTFEEYPNRYGFERIVVFEADNENYSYMADDLMDYFEDKDIEALVLINPDNPSGNYITKNDVERLLVWCNRRGTKLVLDESFADFSDELDNTFIRQLILDANEGLFIIKSIPKSYGVPGLRLGVLASGDTAMVRKLKKDVAIWNINSFAEFYMQIEEKYKNDYSIALKKFREERKRFMEELRKIQFIRVIPTQANYVMLEVQHGWNAKELTKRLLVDHHILIKDLTKKLEGRSFIRVAVRSEEDNFKLIAALKVCAESKIADCSLSSEERK